MNQDVIDNEDIVLGPDQNLANLNLFPGLRSFNFNDSHLFFGQDTVCDQVLAKLKENRFVCLIGNAGVGKTSIINCGIKPALLGGILFKNNCNWDIFHFQPGFNPYQNLARCLIEATSNNIDSDKLPLNQIYLNTLKRGKQGLFEILSQNEDPQRQICIIIDQFEDLFINVDKYSNYQNYEETVQFIDIFLEALDRIPGLHLVISLRADFTDGSAMYPAFAGKINKSNVIVPKMKRGQLKEVITGPLMIYGLKIDEHLLVQILNDISFYDDELPRLQYTLRKMFRLWKNQGNRNKPIDFKEYDNSGGVSNSISNTGNTLFESLSADDKVICERIFKGITQRISENTGVSRPESVSNLVSIANSDIEDIKRIIDLYSTDEAQILTVKKQNLKPVDYIELTHVTIIHSWNKLKSWVEDEAISSQMYMQLAESSASYQIGKVGLLRPPDLNFALNWKEKQMPGLHWAKRYNPAFERTMVYLDASNKAFQAEEELKRNQEKKERRKVRSFYYAFGVIIFLAIGFTIFSQLSRNSAENQKKIALAEKIEAEKKSQKAEIISKEAIIDKEKAVDAANYSEKLRQLALEEAKLLAQQKLLAETSAEESEQKRQETEISLQQIAKQKAQIEKDAQQASVEKNEAEKEKDEAFAKRILTTAQTMAVKSNQMSGNRQLRALLAIQAFKFNSRYDGYVIQPDIYSALVNSSTDFGIQLRTSLKGHSGTVNAVCIATRINILYSTGLDGKIYAWNLNDPTPSPRLVMALNRRNLSLAISANNHYLAVGTDAGIIRVIETNNPESFFEIKGHNGPIFSLAFSRDGQQLFSSSSDKKVLLWDLSSKSNSVVYDESSVRCLSVSPDGRFLAGGSDDGRILLWDIKSNQLNTISQDEPTAIYSIAFNNNGTLVATGDLKGNVRLWNPFSKKLVKNLKSHNARVVDIKFGSVGDIMASASYDGSVYIYDTRFVNNPPQIIREPATYIMSVAFSNDNQKIIMGLNKNEYLISWPSQSQTLLSALCGKLNRDLTTDEWNTYIGADVKYEKQCE